MIDMDSSLIAIIILVIVIGIFIFATRFIGEGLKPGMIVTIMVAVVLTGAVATVVSGDDSSDEEPDIFHIDTLYYDDYVPCSSDTTIDEGSLEVVTVRGETYVHAIGLGEASVSHGSEHHTLTIDKAPLDVYMIAGQSNAEHKIFNRTDAEPVGKIGTTYYYGTSSNVITQPTTFTASNYGVYDMVGTGKYPIAANVDLPFASSLYDSTGHKVLVVNTGVAGSAVRMWMPGGTCYEYAKEAFNDALSKVDTEYYDVSVKDYIWIQGEADSGTSVNTYITRFMAMHDAFIGDDAENVFSDTPFKNCLISKVRAVNGVNSSVAEIQLSKNNETIKMATTITDSFTMVNGLMLGDNLHYSQLGDNLIGMKIAAYIAND